MMAKRNHLYPSRTQKLSSLAPKILGGRLPGKIGRCRCDKKGIAFAIPFLFHRKRSVCERRSPARAERLRILRGTNGKGKGSACRRVKCDSVESERSEGTEEEAENLPQVQVISTGLERGFSASVAWENRSLPVL